MCPDTSGRGLVTADQIMAWFAKSEGVEPTGAQTFSSCSNGVPGYPQGVYWQRELTLRHWQWIVLLLAMAAFLIHLIAQIPIEELDLGELEVRFQNLGFWSYGVFVGAFVILAMFPIPSTLWVLLGGSLFGPVLGTVLSVLSATIAAAMAFLVGRHGARNWVRARASPRLCRVIRGVEAEGWRFVALTRLIPVFPFAPTNYALGCTDLRLGTYVLTTAIALIPNLAAYTWLGYATRLALSDAENLIQVLLLILALIALLLFLPGFVRRLQQTDPDPPHCGDGEVNENLGRGD